MAIKVAISAGEVSGDEHAAKLLRALRTRDASIVARGMGGRFLRASGVETVVDSEKSASAMGFHDVIGELPRFLRLLGEMKDFLREWKPDILILVDFPDFNLRLARFAKSLGIKVFYFIIPKMWVWRGWRLNQFKKYVDHAALIFPFEKDFCIQRGYKNVTYVGHPFTDEFRELPTLSREPFLVSLGLDPQHPVLAVLPGSRKGEVKRHIGPMSRAMVLLASRHPKVQFVIPVAPGINKEALQAMMPPNIKVAISNGGALDLMRVADAGLVKSGTSNLQATFCGLPFAMYFIMSKVSEWAIRRLTSIREYSIVNIIRAGTVRELLQEETSPEVTVPELERLLFDQTARTEMKKNLAWIKVSLGSHDAISGNTAYERAASAVVATMTR